MLIKQQLIQLQYISNMWKTESFDYAFSLVEFLNEKHLLPDQIFITKGKENNYILFYHVWQEQIKHM